MLTSDYAAELAERWSRARNLLSGQFKDHFDLLFTASWSLQEAPSLSQPPTPQNFVNSLLFPPSPSFSPFLLRHGGEGLLLSRLFPDLLVLLLRRRSVFAAQQYAAIFNFGDSLVDAGNLCVDGIPAYLATARYPYGMNFFGYPTGRCSDGRLVIDFIAQELGLPLLPPSKAKNATFTRGANFAITGATALDTSFFEARGSVRPYGTPAPCTPS
uniref:GDSL esterase/lipase n=1 Tax=Ananas comosus var. bracteatus TaxID=296719 RepID=A0A6V7QJF0_ANACO|nr:unnamed protein product [Ananas comosus var. bracteatus]